MNLQLGRGCSKVYNTTTLFVFDNNGNISQETNYSLLHGGSTSGSGWSGFTCAGAFSPTNQTTFNAYTPGVHSSVTIGGATGTPTAISLDATHNTVFKSTGTITIDGAHGAFSSNGQTMELKVVSTCE
jgi:hypothetical protein